MYILAGIAIHLFVTFVVVTVLNFMEAFKPKDDSEQLEFEARINRFVFAFFWEFTITALLLFGLIALLFGELPVWLAKKAKLFLEIRKGKKEKASKESELDEKLKDNLSKEVNGESDSFRSKPPCRKYKY